MSSKILENDIYVFVVAWRTQEILAYRDIKTNEITMGDESKIEQVGYVAVFTRVEDELDNEVTGGWKIIDVSPRIPTSPRIRPHSWMLMSCVCRLPDRWRGEGAEGRSSETCRL